MHINDNMEMSSTICSTFDPLASIVLYIKAGNIIIHSSKTGCNNPYLKSRDLLTMKNIIRNGMLQINILSDFMPICFMLKITKKINVRIANICILT